jgi:hypothetical protein
MKIMPVQKFDSQLYVVPCRGNLWKSLGSAGVVVLLTLFGSMGDCLQPDSKLDPPNPTEPLPPSESPLGVYNDGAVAANCYPCNIVGRYLFIPLLFVIFLQNKCKHYFISKK